MQDNIQSAYPNAHRLGYSTAGEIYQTEVTDETLVATAIAFEHTHLQGASLKLSDVSDSYQGGEQLANSLPSKSLVHVLVISDGQNVNRSELVMGLTQHLPPGVTLTGGLGGDGDRGNILYGLDSQPALALYKSIWVNMPRIYLPAVCCFH